METRSPQPRFQSKARSLNCKMAYYQVSTMATVTSGLRTIVKTGITIVINFGNVTASLFAQNIVRKFTLR